MFYYIDGVDSNNSVVGNGSLHDIYIYVPYLKTHVLVDILLCNILGKR